VISGLLWWIFSGKSKICLKTIYFVTDSGTLAGVEGPRRLNDSRFRLFGADWLLIYDGLASILFVV
jgi:hypothetical protein